MYRYCKSYCFYVSRQQRHKSPQKLYLFYGKKKLDLICVTYPSKKDNSWLALSQIFFIPGSNFARAAAKVLNNKIVVCETHTWHCSAGWQLYCLTVKTPAWTAGKNSKNNAGDASSQSANSSDCVKKIQPPFLLYSYIILYCTRYSVGTDTRYYI